MADLPDIKRQADYQKIKSSDNGREHKNQVRPSPRGMKRLALVGPGYLWMMSAAGSGELLFTPRIGSLYGYALLWALILAVSMKWFINREIGRYTVCTGKTIFSGFKQISGPSNWPFWLILLPQVVVAIATIAGLASSAATALILILPGNIQLWTIISILVSTALVLWGRYQGVERVASWMAVALALASLVAAATVFPNLGTVAAGLVPTLPDQIDFGEVLPWLGFMLSGAAGMMWYSYWIKAKGYGAAEAANQDRPIEPEKLDKQQRENLKRWITQMTLDNTIAVVGTMLITVAFLVLGTELLRPEGLIPEEERIAEVLGRLLGNVWGPIGFWFMIVSVYVGFWNTILSDQDGFGRIFTDGTHLMGQQLGWRGRWISEAFLMPFFVVGLVTVLPILLYLIVGEPVGLLQLAGAIEATHIPVVAGLILYVNHKTLPKDLKASRFVFVATVFSGLFFAVFALVYLFQLWFSS